MSDDNKQWGTIFLDANRESSLTKLDAMQAGTRKDQWNQKARQDYLENVRQKAIDRAREILGEAYTERQNILAEAERDAEAIRNEAKVVHNEADEVRQQAQNLRQEVENELEQATITRNNAQEDGFQAGLDQAQEELNNFRMAMGSSVAGVLHAIEAQCMQIFAHWRQDLVDVVKVCAEKGTALVLEERHSQILEAMLLRAIRSLDERRSITLRVHPEDEPVVADLFAAAKEKNPDLSSWYINADPALQPGDIMAESPTGSVDSRRELYQHMVENIMRHLSLPESQSEAQAMAHIRQALEDEVAKAAALAPPMPEPDTSTPPPMPEPLPLTDPEMILTTTPPMPEAHAEHAPEFEAESELRFESDTTKPESDDTDFNLLDFSPELPPEPLVPDFMSPENVINEAAHDAEEETSSSPLGSLGHLNADNSDFASDTAHEQHNADDAQAPPPPAPPRVSFDAADAGHDIMPPPQPLQFQEESHPVPNAEPSMLELEEELLPVEDAFLSDTTDAADAEHTEFSEQAPNTYQPLKDKA